MMRGHIDEGRNGNKKETDKSATDETITFFENKTKQETLLYILHTQGEYKIL